MIPWADARLNGLNARSTGRPVSRLVADQYLPVLLTLFGPYAPGRRRPPWNGPEQGINVLAALDRSRPPEMRLRC